MQVYESVYPEPVSYPEDLRRIIYERITVISAGHTLIIRGDA